MTPSGKIIHVETCYWLKHHRPIAFPRKIPCDAAINPCVTDKLNFPSSIPLSLSLSRFAISFSLSRRILRNAIFGPQAPTQPEGSPAHPQGTWRRGVRRRVVLRRGLQPLHHHCRRRDHGPPGDLQAARRDSRGHRNRDGRNPDGEIGRDDPPVQPRRQDQLLRWSSRRRLLRRRPESPAALHRH